MFFTLIRYFVSYFIGINFNTNWDFFRRQVGKSTAAQKTTFPVTNLPAFNDSNDTENHHALPDIIHNVNDISRYKSEKGIIFHVFVKNNLY